MDLELGQLRALDAAVTEGSLDAAARALHVTPSAVSQRLKALEAGVGQVLLVRSRPVRATAAGQVVLRLARQVALLTADAGAELGTGVTGTGAPPGADGADAGAQPVGPSLPVAVNADSLGTWFLPAVAPLAGRLRLDVRREDEERTTDLLREGTVVAAVTTQARAVAGCRVTPLGALRYRAMATPDFVRRWFGDGFSAEALRRAPVVLFDRDDDLQHHWLRARGVHSAPPAHYIPATEEHRRAVGLGLGWGMVPVLAAGATDGLVDLAPGAVLDRVLHWQRWRLRSTALDELGEAVVTAARSQLLPIR